MRIRRLAACAATAAGCLLVAVVPDAVAAGSASDPLYPMVSPDGRHLGWVEGTTWRIWTANLDGTGARAFGPAFANNGIGGIAWTRDGIVVDSNYTFFLLSAAGRRSAIAPAADQSFSAGGDRVATDGGQSGGPASVVDLRTRKVTRLPAVVPVLSHDGKHLAWTTNTGVWIATASGAAAHRIVRGRSGCLAWSSDDTSLAYSVFNSGSRGDVHVTSVLGANDRVVARKVAGCSVSWSPDDNYIAVGPTRLVLVHLANHVVTRSPAKVGLVVGGFVWAPDSKSVYVSARPRAAEASGNNCTSLWRLDVPSVDGRIVVPGCH